MLLLWALNSWHSPHADLQASSVVQLWKRLPVCFFQRGQEERKYMFFLSLLQLLTLNSALVCEEGIQQFPLGTSMQVSSIQFDLEPLFAQLKVSDHLLHNLQVHSWCREVVKYPRVVSEMHFHDPSVSPRSCCLHCHCHFAPVIGAKCRAQASE